MIHSFKTRIAALREQGFTLVEIAVTLIIFGVLAAIALPLYLNASRSVSSLDVTTGLVQAASLLDAEKNDNNGLYPTYMPNEILQNSGWTKARFAYTYSDDRLTACLQGQDSNGNKYFVSSTNRDPSSLNCGQANPAKNSPTPWNLDSYPNIDISTYDINWAANASNPTGSVSWTNGTCTDGTTTYQLKLQNLTQGTTTFYPTSGQIQANNSGLTGYSLAPDLSGWLPSDVTTVSAAAVCTESTGGRLYTFIGPYTGLSKTVNVPQFPLTDTTYVVNPQAFFTQNADNSLTMKVSAQFTPITCPALTSGISGTNHPVYQLVAHQDGKTDVGTNTFSTSPGTAASPITLTLNGFTPDTAYNTYTGRAYCEYTRITGQTQHFSGTVSSKDDNSALTNNDGHITTGEWAPVGFPTAPGTPTTVSTNGGQVKPDGLAWTAPTTRACTYGGSLQYSYQQLSPGSSSSPYGAGLSSGLVNWAQGTSYKYIVNAKCVGTHGSSTATASAPVQFTTSVLAPTANFTTNYTSSYSTGQMLADGGLSTADACPAGQRLFKVVASQANENDVTYLGGSNTPTLYLNTNNQAANGFNGDQLVTYKGYIVCRVTQFDGTTKDYAGNPDTSTQYAAVANPSGTATPGTYTSGDPDVIPNGLSWSGQSCPNGGNDQYQYVQLAPGNSTSGWINNASVQDLGWNPGTTYTYRVNFRCDGANRDSDTLTGGNRQFSTNWNTPHSPAAPGAIWTDGNGSSGVTHPNRVLWYSIGCDRGGTAQYLLREVRVDGNYNGNGYNQTDWMTNTTVYNVPDSWLLQGNQIGYQVIARCYNYNALNGQNQISNNGPWSGERNDVTEIYAPGGTSTWQTGNRSIQWNGVGCGRGASPQYRWVQNLRNDAWDSQTLISNWGVYYSGGMDGYNGYATGAYVQTVCAGSNAWSGTANSNQLQWRIPVYAPSIWYVCKPGATSASNRASSGNVSYCNDTGSSTYRKKVAFTLTCANTQDGPWNGNTYWQGGKGIYVNQASGFSTTQLSNGRNTGDGTYGATGSKPFDGANGYTWGSNYNVSGNNAYCSAGNGVNSGTVSRSVDINTGMDYQ
jgi:prepilin-type N-terminal cleavage/methylation domain-containing protein